MSVAHTLFIAIPSCNEDAKLKPLFEEIAAATELIGERINHSKSKDRRAQKIAQTL